MSILPPEAAEPAGPPVVRWVRKPEVTGDICDICKGPTVRVLGMKEVVRPESQGGNAKFRICSPCDGINPNPPHPPKKVVRR